jgi:hypothetical protein
MCLALTPIIAATALAVQTAPLPAIPASQPAGPPTVWSEELAGLETLADEELAEQRGGFTWQGVDVTFGAEIRTYLNGELVLQTNVSWTAEGAQSSQIVSGALTPAAAAQLQAGILTSGGITMKVGDESVFLANGGQTAIVHRTEGAIQNVLINRANNVTGRQEVDAVLNLGNFGQFQDQLQDSRFGQAIGDLVGQATIGSLGN